MKPRVPEAGRSKTELRRGMVVEQGSKEAAITEAEQDFLFAATGEQEKEKTEAAASPSSLPEGEARAGAG